MELLMQYAHLVIQVLVTCVGCLFVLVLAASVLSGFVRPKKKVAK